MIVGPAKIKILRVDSCDNSNYPIQFEIKTRMFNKSAQFIDAFCSLPFDVDDNITISLKSSRVDKHKTQVNSFTLNDAPACSTMTKYVGDLWADIQAQVGMKPGVCPIRMGNYSVKDMVMDLNKLNVQMILEGQFKARIFLKNLSKPLYCSDFVVELSSKNE